VLATASRCSGSTATNERSTFRLCSGKRFR
jgi:hypothetical protein